MSQWLNLDHVLREMQNRLRDERLSDEMRQWLKGVYNDLLYHESTIDDAIWEAKQKSLRNPAFPDDLVGWLDDDFDLPDDEDEEDE